MIYEEQVTQFLHEEESQSKTTHEKKETPPNHGDEDQDLPQIQASGRNDFLLREGCVVAHRNVPKQAVEAYIQSLNQWSGEAQHANFRIQGALDAQEVEKVIESVLGYRKATPRTLMSAEQAIAYMNSRHAIVMMSGKEMETLRALPDMKPLYTQERQTQATVALHNTSSFFVL